MCQHPTHTLGRNSTTAIGGMRDDISDLGHVGGATDPRKAHQGALGLCGQ
jgi:hypothetical protein